MPHKARIRMPSNFYTVQLAMVLILKPKPKKKKKKKRCTPQADTFDFSTSVCRISAGHERFNCLGEKFKAVVSYTPTLPGILPENHCNELVVNYNSFCLFDDGSGNERS